MFSLSNISPIFLPAPNSLPLNHFFPPSQLLSLLLLSSSSLLLFLLLLPPSLGCYISLPVTLTDLMRRGWGCNRMLHTSPNSLSQFLFLLISSPPLSLWAPIFPFFTPCLPSPAPNVVLQIHPPCLPLYSILLPLICSLFRIQTVVSFANIIRSFWFCCLVRLSIDI